MGVDQTADDKIEQAKAEAEKQAEQAMEQAKARAMEHDEKDDETPPSLDDEIGFGLTDIVKSSHRCSPDLSFSSIRMKMTYSGHIATTFRQALEARFHSNTRSLD